MLTFNRQKFFNHYRTVFGTLSQALVDALNDLLEAIEADNVWTGTDTDLRKLAYALATFKHETAHTFRPIHEYGGEAYFNKRYGPQTAVGKRLGNTQPGDGARFAGRGFVQLTGRSNYKRAGDKVGVDLINNPDLAMDSRIAYKIAMTGMREGWFTGKKFSDYFRDGKIPDYRNARRIINGTDRADQIADLARRLMEILRASKI